MISSLTLPDECSRSSGEGLDQPVEVLVRLDVACVQHERRRQKKSLSDARDLRLGRRRFEALVEGVGNHFNLALGHLEVVHDVLLRRVGDGQDALMRGAPPAREKRARVKVRAAMRQVLREP